MKIVLDDGRSLNIKGSTYEDLIGAMLDAISNTKNYQEAVKEKCTDENHSYNCVFYDAECNDVTEKVLSGGERPKIKAAYIKNANGATTFNNFFGYYSALSNTTFPTLVVYHNEVGWVNKDNNLVDTIQSSIEELENKLDYHKKFIDVLHTLSEKHNI